MASKLKEPVVSRLLEAIELGATYELACKYAGITYQTLLNWRTRGASAKSGKYKTFVSELEEAEGRATVRWLNVIEQAAEDGTWVAAAWKLERRYPNEYGRKRLDIATKDPMPIVIVKRPDDGSDLSE